MKAFFAVASLFMFATLVPGAYIGGDIGSVDGILGSAIVGWACQKGVRESIDVHSYIYFAYLTGRFINQAQAKLTSKSVVPAACGTLQHALNCQYDRHRFPANVLVVGYTLQE